MHFAYYKGSQFTLDPSNQYNRDDEIRGPVLPDYVQDSHLKLKADDDGNIAQVKEASQNKPRGIIIHSKNLP